MLRKSHKLLICETFAGKPDTTAARLSYFDFFFLFIFNHIPGHYNLAGFELFTVLFEEIKLKSMSSSESSRLRMTGIKLQTWSKTSLTLQRWQHPILQSESLFLAQTQPQDCHKTFPVWRCFSGFTEAQKSKKAAERPVGGCAKFNKTSGKKITVIKMFII